MLRKIILLIFLVVALPNAARYQQVDLSLDPSYSIERTYTGDPRPTYRVVDYYEGTTTDLILPGPTEDSIDQRSFPYDNLDSWDSGYNQQEY